MFDIVILDIKDKGMLVEVNEKFLHLLNKTFRPQIWWR